MSEPERISREEAIERIKQADRGILVIGELEPVPTLGEVKPTQRKYKAEVESYSFGDMEAEDEQK